MTHPEIVVDIDGVPASGVFFDRLVSLLVTDREGIRSDTIEMVFSDDAPHFAQPRRGAVVTASIKGKGGVGGFVGRYVIDSVVNDCLPYKITVKGHSADLRSKMKTGKSRHWDGKSVKDIVTQIAGDHELEPRISDVVSRHVYDWIGQQDETDLHFLERLARRHGALFTVKNGALLWLELGAGKTATGVSLPPAVVVTTDIVLGSMKVQDTDVDRFGKVKALYQDHAGAARREVIVDGDTEADGEHVLRQPYSSQDEARLAAEAFAREMLRGLKKVSCSVVGRPSLMAGQPVTFLGVRPGIDGLQFIAETVKHRFTKVGGLATSFDGKLRIIEKEAS